MILNGGVLLPAVDISLDQSLSEKAQDPLLSGSGACDIEYLRRATIGSQIKPIDAGKPIDSGRFGTVSVGRFHDELVAMKAFKPRDEESFRFEAEVNHLP